MRNCFIIYLGLILIVQSCLTYVIRENADSTSEEDKQLNGNNKLYKEILKEFIDFSIKTSEVFYESTMKIQEEMKENNDLPDGLPNRRHQKFYEILTDIKSSESTPAVLNVYKLTKEIVAADQEVDKFRGDTSSAQLIEKYKIREVMDKIRDRYTTFYENVSKAVEAYWDELNESQKEEQELLFDWNKVFKKEKKFQLKAPKFIYFFHIFMPFGDED
uniref:Uncharacterized protein n=1 Tax=Glossina brevipalpis TaxID=37001 RepID=A0A1A9W1H9_9MUSC